MTYEVRHELFDLMAKHNTGNGVVLDTKDDIYIFGRIMCALFFQNDVYLLCNLLNIERFSFHFNSFDCIEPNNLKLVKINDLLDYHPLGYYTVQRKNYVPLRHNIHLPSCV